ncbi:MAG TPA: phosphatase PAP2 family protein [Micropepsaceae bacterium]|jgi:acid phosphatase (class A)|nr:phosphatase PAP2 family protein [Micropepsaceae bacterium]
MRRFAFAPALLLCLAATPVLALSDKPYITAADVDFSMMLPPPPKEDSPAGKRDLQTILDLQKNMTPQLDAAIHKDLDQSVYTVAGPVLGPKFTKENFPLAGEFFAKVVKDAGVGVGPIKQKYKKLRSFQYSKEVKTPDDIAKAAGGPTYPSGHSTTAAEVALLMGMMVPEKREALYDRSDEYATHRITSGAAYPSDRMGGYITASLAINQMMKNPEFRADYEAVKAEVRKGLGLS